MLKNYYRRNKQKVDVEELLPEKQTKSGCWRIITGETNKKWMLKNYYRRNKQKKVDV